ncbi:hypothetical protein, partial [Paracoccus hibiscisoli]|uniref:hypothetical protein n=1 Tax=Paracoccus hibiscisoli TaxID=2023261 RepID=UPI0023F3CAD9
TPRAPPAVSYTKPWDTAQTEGLLGRKVSRINIDSWDDIDAKNAFINGVDRWSNKVIRKTTPATARLYDQGAVEVRIPVPFVHAGLLL